jgi:dimethylamine/trimethylamine dehydrogenase
MAREPRYDILFEPVAIGPVRTRNRFYQVPHCSGMGYRYPSAEATLRGLKAEGGWGVVCTQECEIHHTSDVGPYTEARLWDDRDIPALARMVEAVHAQGALAGVQLVHQGPETPNRYSRENPIAPSHSVIPQHDPVQARAMDKSDIRDLRRWHREAALRAKRAGFDLIYVYAGHHLTVFSHFLSRRTNHRTDEYGGSLENRVRLLREVIEETKEAIGDRCAVPLRLAVEELMGPDGITAEGEGREIVEMLAELPDLWDVNLSGWVNDSQTSRFAEEGFQEPYVAFVKELTSKPVVGVGRFTSPDAMVRQIKRGILDLIGAARPSIADPFLPRKINEGRIEDIRECIGCNICTSGDRTGVPMRCTQNPTMGEEWRRGWHPEIIPAKTSDDAVLVVGAGPAGLECARALGQRGYAVTLADAREELGGRVATESRLPGLSAWARVRDYRVGQLNQMANVEVYRASSLGKAEILELASPRVVLATGARWRRDGVGRQNHSPIPGSDRPQVLTPEAVIAASTLPGPALVFDDDHFYLGGALAEKLRGMGVPVTLVTPALEVSAWTHNTLEQEKIERRLVELGVTLMTRRNLTGIGEDDVELTCLTSGEQRRVDATTVVLVTARLPVEDLYLDLMADPDSLSQAGIASVTRIGDCNTPSTIAAAVYAGHRYARELDQPAREGVPFKRELAALDPEFDIG